MKVLLLGVGMQGKAALADLVASDQVDQIVAADADHAALERFVAGAGWRGRVRTSAFDAADRASLDRLLADRPDVVLDLTPARFVVGVAAAVIDAGIHLVNTCFLRPEVAALAERAAARDVAILAECGLDPGIDLLLLGDAVSRLDTVGSIRTYGAGLPELAAADNPLKYKVTWSFEGVIGAYHRPARQIRDGRPFEVDGASLFAPEHVEEIDIDGVGRLEAYPNANALPLADRLGLDPAQLDHLGCYTMRWPGHCAFWRQLTELHLLDDEPVIVDGIAVDRRRFLARAIAPHILLGDDERDVVVLRVEVTGTLGGQPARVVRQLVEYRDLETGLTAMSRTVGFTASIGTQLLGGGALDGRGLLSTARDVPFGLFVGELARRGIDLHTS